MLIEMLKVILLGIVEGITEWLPISSTGHMILVDEFIKLNVPKLYGNVFSSHSAWCDSCGMCDLFP